MNKEKRKEYQKAYREAHKEEMKAYYEEHKEQLKELHKKWYNENKEKHKELCKKYKEEHKDEIKAYQRNYHKNYNKAYYKLHNYDKFKEYLQVSDNKKKHYTRIKSSRYLFKTLKHTKIKEYEIHHCFGYDNFKHFIYIPKELHIEIHQFLRDNNINADSNHFSQIEHIIANYLEQNDKHILVL